MEAGEKHLAGYTARASTTDEVKEVVAEQTIELHLLKKACSTVRATRMRYLA